MDLCYANSPTEFTPAQWWAIARRTLGQVDRDNVTVVAAGVAFFTMLAIFPLITAGLSLYGYVADPASAISSIQIARSVLPADAWALLEAQVIAVTSAPSEGLRLGVIIGLGAALYSAGAGVRAVMKAMNIAYGEREKRSIIVFYATGIAFTLGVGLFLVTALAVIVGIPAVLNVIRLDQTAAALARFLPFIALILNFSLAVFILYRFGPSRRPAKFRWVLPGVVLATVLWLIVSIGFNTFVSQFGNYNETYGSISAVIVMLLWFWLTAVAVLIGAEFNAEMERQTLCDTTRGPYFRIGRRGAAMADYVPPGVIPAQVDPLEVGEADLEAGVGEIVDPAGKTPGHPGGKFADLTAAVETLQAEDTT